MSRSHQPTLVHGDQVLLKKHSIVVEKFLRSELLWNEHRVESYSVLFKRLLHPEPFWKVGTLRRIPRPSIYLREAALRESDILNLIREEGGHPHIVELIDSNFLSRENDVYYLFADEEIGTLSEIVGGVGRDRRKISEKEVLDIALQICEAVSFLHNFQPPLIHRNITPDNIVITSKNVVKLSGLIGAALELAPYALAETKIPALLQDILCYTDPVYRCSPEMVDPQTQSGITTKADVWSMGVVLYFIAFNQSLTLFDSDLFGDVYYNSRGYRNVVAIIGSTMRRDPKMRPAIKEVRDKIRAICGIRTPLPSGQETLRPFPSEKRFYKSFIMPRDSYILHLAPRVVPTHLGIPPSFPGFTSQQGNTSNWSPPRLLTSLLNDFPRIPGEPRLPRLPPGDEEQTLTEGDSSFHDTDSTEVNFLSDNESTSSQEEAESESVYQNAILDDIGPVASHDSKRYPPSSHRAIRATKNASSTTSQPLDGTLRIRSAAPRWIRKPLPDKSEISTPVKPNQSNGTSLSQKRNLHGSTSNSARIVSTTAAPAEAPLPLPPRGILKKGSNNSDSRASRPSTTEKKPQDRRDLEKLTWMRPEPSSDSVPRGQSSTRPQGRSKQEIKVSEEVQPAGADVDRQSQTSSSTPSDNSGSTLRGPLQTNSSDRPSRTPSPLVDDISSQITWISPTASKVNGHFCDVFEGKHSTAGKVALKRPRIGATGYDAVIVRRFEREAVTWRSLKHPHILEFLGTFQRDGHLYFVSPYIENGTLVEYVVRYPDVDRIRLLRETAEAVYYLHNKGIVHGDIKASNILIDDHGHSLLCDFGLTKMTQSRTSTSMRGAGTVRWQSPELWNDAPKSAEADVYAFAMTIVEVLTGKPPFGHLLNDMAVMLAVIQHDERPARSPLTSSTGASYERTWDVAAACWAKEPDKRITMFTAFERLRVDLSLL